MPRTRVILFLALIAGIPLLPFVLEGGGWPECHESVRYFLLFEHFRDAIGAGIPYPRWLPELHGGLGYPTFVFYQPGFFYWQLPFAQLTNDPLWIVYLSLYGLFALGAGGAWLLARQVGGDLGGYIGAVLFMLTPYAFVNLYWRCDLSELAAMLIMPWPFALTLWLNRRLEKTDRPVLPICLALIAALTALFYSHPVGLVFALPVFAIFVLWLGADRKSKAGMRLWFSAGCSVCIALALSAPYWATVIEMSRHVNLQAAFRGHYVPEKHFAQFTDFIMPRWSVTDLKYSQLGLPHLVMAVTGAIALRRDRVVQFAFVALLLLMLAMTETASALWSLPMLRTMQFPWRIMSVVATIQVLCAGGIVRFLPARRSLRFWVLAAALGTSVGWYHVQFQFIGSTSLISRESVTARRKRDTKALQAYAQADEFRPRWAPRDHVPRASGQPLLVAPAPAQVVKLSRSSADRLRYQVSARDPVTLTIRQFYLPGWRVEIDGKPIPDAALRRDVSRIDGTIQFTMPKGTHRIEAWYEGPVGWRRRNLLILFFVFAGLAILGFLDWRGHTRRKPWPTTEPAGR